MAKSTPAFGFWLRRVYPLWLREKVFWRFYAMRPKLAPRLFEAAPLLFARNQAASQSGLVQRGLLMGLVCLAGHAGSIFARILSVATIYD